MCIIRDTIQAIRRKEQRGKRLTTPWGSFVMGKEAKSCLEDGALRANGQAQVLDLRHAPLSTRIEKGCVLSSTFFSSF